MYTKIECILELIIDFFESMFSGCIIFLPPLGQCCISGEMYWQAQWRRTNGFKGIKETLHCMQLTVTFIMCNLELTDAGF